LRNASVISRLLCRRMAVALASGHLTASAILWKNMFNVRTK
jgi:hypothetical protein